MAKVAPHDDAIPVTPARVLVLGHRNLCREVTKSMTDGSFYLTMVELSGTLIGLAFVAITHHFSSLRTDLFSDPRHNLKAKALWTCVFDSAVLSLSLLLLPFCASLIMLTITPESDMVKIAVGLLGFIWAGVMLVVFREKLYARRMGRSYEYEVDLPLRVEDYIQLTLGVFTTGSLSMMLIMIGCLPTVFPHGAYHVSVDQLDAYVRVVCALYIFGGLLALYNDLFSPYPLTTYPAERALLKLPDVPTEPGWQRIKRLLRLLPRREAELGRWTPSDAPLESFSPGGATHPRNPIPAEAAAARLRSLEETVRDLLQAWDARRDIQALLEARGELRGVTLSELELWMQQVKQCRDCLEDTVEALESMLSAASVDQEDSEEEDPADY